MLRSLISDPENKRDGQPKPVKEMDDRERHYVEVVSPQRDLEWKRDRALKQREAFREDVRAAIEDDVTKPADIAKRLGCSEMKVKMTLKEMRLID